MEWILLEIAVALGLAGFIIWYTVGSKPRPARERKNEPGQDDAGGAAASAAPAREDRQR